MGAEVIILANPYTYNFIKGLTHSALVPRLYLFDFIYSSMLSLVNSDFSIIQGQFWPRADMAALGQSEKIILEKVLHNNFANQ